MSNNNSDLVPPLKKSEEIALATIRGLAGELPFGGLLVELVPIIAPQRIKEFFRTTDNELRKLVEAKYLKAEDLIHSEVFFTTLLHAAQIAVRNHQQEKLEALRNAVLNTALPSAPSDEIALMFLSYVDRLTTWHIRILSLFNTPDWQLQIGFTREPTEKETGKSRISISALKPIFPELAGRSDWQEQLMRDLSDLHLLHLVGAALWGGGTDWQLELGDAAITTETGKQFLVFISSPLPPDAEAKSL